MIMIETLAGDKPKPTVRVNYQSKEVEKFQVYNETTQFLKEAVRNETPTPISVRRCNNQPPYQFEDANTNPTISPKMQIPHDNDAMIDKAVH